MLKFYEYMPTIMEYLADDNSHSSKEIRKFCCDKVVTNWVFPMRSKRSLYQAVSR